MKVSEGAQTRRAPEEAAHKILLRDLANRKDKRYSQVTKPTY